LGTIVSARSGETEDTSIVHLAIGWGAGQLKIGSFPAPQRKAKRNEDPRTEEALGSQARFAGLDEMPMRRRAAPVAALDSPSKDGRPSERPLERGGAVHSPSTDGRPSGHPLDRAYNGRSNGTAI